MFKREEQIPVFDTLPVSTSTETLVHNKGEILRAAVHPAFIRLDLIDAEGELDELTTVEERSTAYPSHWSTLLVTHQSYALSLEQFGTGSDDEAKMDRQLMHRLIQTNAAHFGVDAFALHGGHVVERARAAGRGIFGVLEVNNVLHDQELIKFVTLSYPKALIQRDSKRLTNRPGTFMGIKTTGEATQMVLSAFASFATSTEDLIR